MSKPGLNQDELMWPAAAAAEAKVLNNTAGSTNQATIDDLITESTSVRVIDPLGDYPIGPGVSVRRYCSPTQVAMGIAGAGYTEIIQQIYPDFYIRIQGILISVGYGATSNGAVRFDLEDASGTYIALLYDVAEAAMPATSGPQSVYIQLPGDGYLIPAINPGLWILFSGALTAGNVAYTIYFSFERVGGVKVPP